MKKGVANKQNTALGFPFGKFITALLLLWSCFLAILLLSPTAQRAFIFLNWINWPRFAKFNQPAVYGFRSSEVDNFVIKTNESKIGCWLVKSRRPTQKAALFIHGNAGNRLESDHLVMYSRLVRELGMNLLVIDYRGFGDTEGPQPTEQGVKSDTLAAWNWLNGKFPDFRKYIVGHSLGTALSSSLALELCKNECPSGLILLSSVHSVIEVMMDYPGISILLSPLKLVPEWREWISPYIADHFNNSQNLHDLKPTETMPLLLIHGQDDREVPSKNSRLLFTELTGFEDYEGDSKSVERYQEANIYRFTKGRFPVTYLEVAHAGHNDIQYHFNVVFDEIESFTT
jgi:alpha-beta hydrolase superfamily lysophospholipase